MKFGKRKAKKLAKIALDKFCRVWYNGIFGA
jgi:hypothetical protein